MNFDLPPQSKSENVPSYKKEVLDDGTRYIFDHVGVKIDTSGKNYKELPELLFGTFDVEPNPEALNQPEVKREGIDMAYVAQCIEEAAKDSGVHEFWFYPLGTDASSEEGKGEREQARLRLFQRIGNISPAPGGFGYILKV